MVGLPTTAFGLMIDVLEAAECILEDGIAPLQASTMHIVVATFREAATLDSGVSGIVVMVQ